MYYSLCYNFYNKGNASHFLGHQEQNNENNKNINKYRKKLYFSGSRMTEYKNYRDFCYLLGLNPYKELDLDTLRENFKIKAENLHPDYLRKLYKSDKISKEDYEKRAQIYTEYSEAYDRLKDFIISSRLGELRTMLVDEELKEIENTKHQVNKNLEYSKREYDEISKEYKKINSPESKLLLLKDPREKVSIKDFLKNQDQQNLQNPFLTSLAPEKHSNLPENYNREYFKTIKEIKPLDNQNKRVLYCRNEEELNKTLKQEKALFVNTVIDPFEVYFTLTGGSKGLKNKISYWYNSYQPCIIICPSCNGFESENCRSCRAKSNDIQKYEIKKEKDFFEWTMTQKDLMSEYILVLEKGDYLTPTKRGPLVIKLSYKKYNEEDIQVERHPQGMKLIKSINSTLYSNCIACYRPLVIEIPLINSPLHFNLEKVKEFSYIEDITKEIVDEITFERRKEHTVIPEFNILLELKLYMDDVDDKFTSYQYKER